MKKFLVACFWLAVWEIIALCVDNPLLFAGPVQVISRIPELIVHTDFLRIAGGSLGRIFAGFGIGTFLGILLAVTAYKNNICDTLMQPVLHFLKTVPVASFVVLLLIWWGTKGLTIAISAIVVLPQIYFAVLEGLKSTDLKMLEMTNVFKLPLMSRIVYIYMPLLKPFLMSGLKVSLGMCWKAGVAAEIIGVPDYSLGEQLYLSKVYLDTAGLFLWTFVIIGISLLMEKACLFAVELVFGWNPACKKPKTGKTGSGSAPAVVVEHLGKRFGDKIVFSDECRHYPAESVSYLREPSGSGKTTLFKILAGLERADAGEVCGTEEVAMQFQEDRLCESFDAVKNVELVTGDATKAKEALLKVLSEEDLHKTCSVLSGGMKRRVSLVRAMESTAPVVLLDEPFTGMDEATKKAAQEYIDFAKRGRTILIASHIEG